MASRAGLSQMTKYRPSLLARGRVDLRAGRSQRRYLSSTRTNRHQASDGTFTTEKLLIGTGILTGLALTKRAFALGQREDRGLIEHLDLPSLTESASDILHSRIRGDVCRLGPNLSDLVIDVTELLKEKHTTYISELMRRKTELEKSLTTRRASEPGHPEVANSFPFEYNKTEEQLQWTRSEYNATLQKLDEVLQSVNLMASAARTLGANSCLDASESVVREAMFVRDSIIKVVQQSEDKMRMAEKLYRSRIRREVKENKTKLL